MKLYYAPGACSLAPHIVLNEAGIAHEAIKVDLAKKLAANGEDYNVINPKGYVPALVLDSGEVITEGPAVSQYIADQMPAAKLAPAWGTHARYHLLEWLNFISTEIHKQFSPLFRRPDEAQKAKQIELISRRYAYVNAQLEGKSYLMDEDFTVADAYLFVTMRWAEKFGFDFTQWKNLEAWYARVSARPKVKQTLIAEGLIKA